MLDFICMGSGKLFAADRERKIQNEKKNFQRDSNPRHANPQKVNLHLRPLGQGALVRICGFYVLQDIRIQIK